MYSILFEFYEIDEIQKYKSNELFLNGHTLDKNDIYEDISDRLSVNDEYESFDAEPDIRDVDLSVQNRRSLVGFILFKDESLFYQSCAQAGIIRSIELVNFMVRNVL